MQIRGEDGTVLDPGQTGELFVRGEQVSGRYTEIGSVLDADGWFPTKDVAMLDEDGYLFIGGRSDDTIIRGGENIAPAEIEDVLVEHPAVRDVAVVGAEDPEWGQIIVAVVVPATGAAPEPDELREHVRTHLRGSRTPDRVVFRDELPTNATGKVLRRELVQRPEISHQGASMIKNGTRLQSQVCDTQVIVVKPPTASTTCAPAASRWCRWTAEKSADATLDPAFSDGNADGQALRRRGRRRSARHQGRRGNAQRRVDRAEPEGSQAATRQRLTPPQGTAAV